MQEILITTQNKVEVIRQIMTQYRNIYKTEDEHLTWLEALNHFYSKSYDRAAELLRELINMPNSTYVNRAGNILNDCVPHLGEASENVMPKA